MKTDIRDAWAERLESGIEQGKGVLGTVDGKRCCLGVLCDMAVEAGVIDVYEYEYENGEGPTGRLFYGDDNHRSLTTLPHAVQNWAGIDDENPIVIGPRVDPYTKELEENKRTSLAELNDAEYNFNFIAGVIREQL